MNDTQFIMIWGLLCIIAMKLLKEELGNLADITIFLLKWSFKILWHIIKLPFLILGKFSDYLDEIAKKHFR